MGYSSFMLAWALQCCLQAVRGLGIGGDHVLRLTPMAMVLMLREDWIPQWHLAQAHAMPVQDLEHGGFKVYP